MKTVADLRIMNTNSTQPYIYKRNDTDGKLGHFEFPSSHDFIKINSFATITDQFKEKLQQPHTYGVYIIALCTGGGKLSIA